METTPALILTDRHVALDSILSTRDELSTSTLLDIARELDLEQVALHRMSTNQTLDRLDDPGSAWNALVSDDVGNSLQLDLLKLVASTWKEQEGLGVLLQAAALFLHTDDRAALSTVIEGVVGAQLTKHSTMYKTYPVGNGVNFLVL